MHDSIQRLVVQTILICSLISTNLATKSVAKDDESSSVVHNIDKKSVSEFSPSVYVPNSAWNSNYYPHYNYEVPAAAYVHRPLESNYYSARQGKLSAAIPLPIYVPNYSDSLGEYSSHPDYVTADQPSRYMDNLYMASSKERGNGQGNSHGHGHGHGWGWGWGHGGHGPPPMPTNYRISTLNTDGIGLLGLLGLLSILQAILLALTTTTAAGRRKRDADGVEIDADTELVNHVSKLLLPSFNIIASVQCKRIPSNCTQLEVCRINNLLVNDVGGAGIDAAEKITDAISGMLARTDDKLAKEISSAGEFGRNEMQQCEEKYPICKELETNGVYSLPVLLNKNHPLYYDHTHKLKNRVKH